MLEGNSVISLSVVKWIMSSLTSWGFGLKGSRSSWGQFGTESLATCSAGGRLQGKVADGQRLSSRGCTHTPPPLQTVPSPLLSPFSDFQICDASPTFLFVPFPFCLLVSKHLILRKHFVSFLLAQINVSCNLLWSTKCMSWNRLKLAASVFIPQDSTPGLTAHKLRKTRIRLVVLKKELK